MPRKQNNVSVPFLLSGFHKEGLAASYVRAEQSVTVKIEVQGSEDTPSRKPDKEPRFWFSQYATSDGHTWTTKHSFLSVTMPYHVYWR
jgi:hypothetical protein